MPESRFDAWVAERYDVLWPELFEPTVVEQTVEFLARWAGLGPALEFGIGTGRIAVPLSRRGMRVHGIELSRAMVEQLQVRSADAAVGVTVGDFATVTVEDQFTLIYLLRNTITNLTSQDEQVEAFRNAARHLQPGGHFVIENY
jgi:SAM-dependent methyltransferase